MKFCTPLFFFLCLFTFLGCVGNVERAGDVYQVQNIDHNYDPITEDVSEQEESFTDSDFQEDITQIVDDGLAEYIDQTVSPQPHCQVIMPQKDFDQDSQCIPYNKKQFGPHGGKIISSYIKAQEKKGGTKAKKKAFYRSFAPLAVRIRQDTGYPASALLAQWAVETAWGTSRLLRKGNGIGGHSCFKKRAPVKYKVFKNPHTGEKGHINAKCVYPRPKNEKHYYLTFNTLEDSAYAQIQNIMYNPRTNRNYYRSRKEVFNALKEQRMVNPNKVVDGLVGYAAAPPSYRADLKKRIRRDKLQKFDNMIICDQQEGQL